MSWERPVAAFLLAVGGLATGLMIFGEGSMPILFVGLLTLGLGIALLVQDAQRTGRRIAWQGAVGTILGMVLVVIGLGLIVIGFVLLVLIITAPIGIGLMLAGLLAVVLGIAIAGLSWLPWRKRGRPDVIDAEVIDD